MAPAGRFVAAADALDAYRDQVRLYARAIAAATNRPAGAILLRL